MSTINMLAALIQFALTHRPLILGLCIVVLVYGGYAASVMPIDVFPDLDRPRVVILVECAHLAPEDIEQRVTLPIEVALLGAPGVSAVRSQSGQQLAVIIIDFDWRIDSRQARLVVNERLGGIPLPPGIKPHLTPPASLMGQIMHIGLVWQPHAGQSHPGQPHSVNTHSPASRGDDSLDRALQLRTIADSMIRPRLLQQPGVAEVIILGGSRQQYQILLDAEKLHDHGISIGEIHEAILRSNVDAAGGLLETGNSELPVRVLSRIGPGSARTLADLQQIPIRMTSVRPVLLGDLAVIAPGAAPRRGDAGIDGRDGVLITIVKQPHADTRAVTDNVERVLENMKSSLPPGITITTELFQLKSFIDRGVHSVAEALMVGAGLVMIVLVLFLLNARTTLITLTAIPLSLAVTAAVFHLMGVFTGTAVSINVMTLGGLAVAMGELVDDAIVDVENIYRRLGENAAAAAPRSPLRVVLEASREIRSAIVFGTAVVILAFVPLFALSGIEGRLFTPLGLAYIISILASLLVSLTVTPVLSYYLLGRFGRPRGSTRPHGPSLLLRLLRWLGRHVVQLSLRRLRVCLLCAWVAIGLAAWQLTRLGADFLPKFDEGSVQINVALPANSSLQASNRVAGVIDARLRRLQVSAEQPLAPIRHFVRRTGRAELDEHAEPVNRSEYILTMNPQSSYRRDEFLRMLLADLRAELPGVEFDAEQPLAHLISHMLSGVSAQVAIKVYGDDLDRLRDLSLAIHQVVSGIPGVDLPVVDPQDRVDELHIVPRPDDLAAYGLHRADVAELVQLAMAGIPITTVYDGPRRFDVAMRLQESQRADRECVGNLLMNSPAGGRVRLRDVADFPPWASGPNLINHEGARRRQTIRCNVVGRDLASTVAEIEAAVRRRVQLPTGYLLEFGGQFQAQRNATQTIALLAAASILGMMFALLMLFPSIRIVLQILHAVPVAFSGGVAALTITGQSLTVASLVGFVSLGGIAVRNGILLVAHYLHLMRHEGEEFNERMILRGSMERLAPVLMTALTAMMALLPLVIAGHQPGREILYPVATVIVGGLAASTLCEFLLHPGLFFHLTGRDAARIARSGAPATELDPSLQPSGD